MSATDDDAEATCTGGGHAIAYISTGKFDFC
jgi:hypothetical protein